MTRKAFGLKLIGFICFIHLAASAAIDSSQCRCFPGDSCWPSHADWAGLNASISGRLVATVPLGSPCHDPTYNAAECKILQTNWFEPSEQWAIHTQILIGFYY